MTGMTKEEFYKMLYKVFLSLLLIISVMSVKSVRVHFFDRNINAGIDFESVFAEGEEDIQLDSEFDDRLDPLQQLYVQIEDISRDDLVQLIENEDLFYSEREFSSGPTIKIAYNEDVVPMQHAKMGDYIKVSFDKELNIDQVTYFNNKNFLTLLDYRNGTYYSFHDQPEYAGYYVYSPGKEIGDFTIKYDNGNETNTGYVKLGGKKQQLEFLFNYKRD